MRYLGDMLTVPYWLPALWIAERR